MAVAIEAGDCFKCDDKLCRFLSRDGLTSQPHSLVLKRGERLETCPENCLGFWVVVRGTAAICVSLPDGRRQIRSIETVGSTICGPIAKVEDATWLEALEPCEICELDFSGQAEELRNDSGLLAAMFGVVHTRLGEASRHLTTLGRLDSTERVVLFLAEMAQRSDTPGPVHLPMSRDDIADYLGLNSETVSRIFTRLKKSGLFKFSSPTDYLVPDFAAVERRLPVPVPEHSAGPAGTKTQEARSA